jgi:hypothetical protein
LNGKKYVGSSVRELTRALANKFCL